MYQNKQRNRRRGSVAVLVAAMLVVIIGVLAMPLDGGMMMDNRRRAQEAADAAALAAGTELFINYPTIVAANFTIADPNGSAKAAALANAAQNGYANDGVHSTVTVNIPPQSGPFAGLIGYAEVLISFNQPRYLSSIWNSQPVPVQARAVSLARWYNSGQGIVCLDPSAKDSLIVSGGAAATMAGSAYTYVNSNNTVAAADTGGGSITGPDFEITGSYTGNFNGVVHIGTRPIPDPLRYLPVPTPPPAGSITKQPLGSGNFQYTLTPGTYTSLPNLNQGDVLILEQASYNNNGGIYYLSGTGFKSTGASITMDPQTSGGVMIYNAPTSNSNSQKVDITGNPSGTVNLSPLTSGPYAGILLWQDRNSSVSLNIAGNGNFSLLGTLYAANANMSITGNGNTTIGSQYISDTLSLGGNGNITIDYNPNLTARIREVILVE